MNEYITIHAKVLLTFWTSVYRFIGRTIGEHLLTRIAFIGLLLERTLDEIRNGK